LYYGFQFMLDANSDRMAQIVDLIST
jgi:hypothetical protein